MKTTISKISLLFAMGILFFSCSKEDTDVGPTRFEYEYPTETPMPDQSIRLITINVDADRVIIDPTKVFIEITMSHTAARDLSYGYLMPNDGDEMRMIVSNLGGLNGYSSSNKLVFNPTALESINPSEDYLYPNFIIPAGIYKEGTSSAEFPVESPLFHTMMNKNIRGDWKFIFLDTVESNEGNIVKVKLIFEEGALKEE